MNDPLLPPERMALTVAKAQIKRGEDPTPNVAAVLIMALARLIDKFGDEPLYRESYPNPGDGSALSPKDHDEAHEAWYQVGLAKERGYLIRVWPEEGTSDGLSTTDEQ